MNTSSSASPANDRELVIHRVIDLPVARLYQGWTDPALLVQWFAPLPWTTAKAELDVRPGGSSLVVMCSPEGDEYSNPGVYLEVVPNERLVVTDAYTHAWQPSEAPFMTLILTFEDLGDGRTDYTARVLHWSVADREKHEAMGFHTGWNLCLDQLIELLGRQA